MSTAQQQNLQDKYGPIIVGAAVTLIIGALIGAFGFVLSTNNAISEANSKIGNQQVVLAVYKVDMEKGFNNAQSEVSGLKNDVSAMRSDVVGVKSDLSVVRGDVISLKSDVSGLKSDVSGLKSDVNGLKSDVNGLKNDIRNLTRALLRSQEKANPLAATPFKDALVVTKPAQASPEWASFMVVYNADTNELSFYHVLLDGPNDPSLGDLVTILAIDQNGVSLQFLKDVSSPTVASIKIPGFIDSSSSFAFQTGSIQIQPAGIDAFLKAGQLKLLLPPVKITPAQKLNTWQLLANELTNNPDIQKLLAPSQ